MYKVNPPKIHLSTVIGYDVEEKRYIVKDEMTFGTERELDAFLRGTIVQYVILRGSL